MDKNTAWFIRANLKRYKGKYIAIAEGRVVLSGSKPGKIYEKAKALHPKVEVILWKVPEGEAFAF
jgi:hypothetical protein